MSLFSFLKGFWYKFIGFEFILKFLVLIYEGRLEFFWVWGVFIYIVEFVFDSWIRIFVFYCYRSYKNVSMFFVGVISRVKILIRNNYVCIIYNLDFLGMGVKK